MRAERESPATGQDQRGNQITFDTYQYTTTEAFARLLKVRVSEIWSLKARGLIPPPCKSTGWCDFWFTQTAHRIKREADEGRLWLGGRQ